MMPIDIFLSFFSTCTLLALSPGPDNIFVLLQSALYGIRIGIYIVFGLCTGLLFHTFFVIISIEYIIKISPSAFLALRIIGALYLLYLAYLTIKSTPISLDTEKENHTPTMSLWQYYQRGILMNISNPKVTLFFLAFLPQFIYSTAIPMSRQLLVLGGIFILATFLTFNSIAIFSGYFGRLIKRSSKMQQRLNTITAIVFIGLAIKLFIG